MYVVCTYSITCTIKLNVTVTEIFIFLKQVLDLLAGEKIDWVRDRVPIDEPICGFYGEHCMPGPSNFLVSYSKLQFFRFVFTNKIII